MINLCNAFEDSFSYYQGMNYVVAFLMVIFPEDPTTVLQMSCTMLKGMIMKYVGTKLDGLKGGFYTLNRLVQMHQPVIYAKLRSERVTVDIFCSPWFLTCFSLAAQHDKHSENLRRIWDILLAVKKIIINNYRKAGLVFIKWRWCY